GVTDSTRQCCGAHCVGPCAGSRREKNGRRENNQQATGTLETTIRLPFSNSGGLRRTRRTEARARLAREVAAGAIQLAAFRADRSCVQESSDGSEISGVVEEFRFEVVVNLLCATSASSVSLWLLYL